MEQGRGLWEKEGRQGVYADFSRLFAAEAPAVYLYYQNYSVLVSNKVNGPSLEMMLDPIERFRSFSDWFMVTKREFPFFREFTFFTQATGVTP